MTNTTHPFAPDWVSSPGETIMDLLDEREWTQTQLAKRLGYSEPQVSQLINGEIAISTEIAYKLVEIFGSTVNFWLKLEAIYRSQLAKTLIQEQQLQVRIP
jgi:addiction module HigA family antidote